jgi:hypothetical protein
VTCPFDWQQTGYFGNLPCHDHQSHYIDIQGTFFVSQITLWKIGDLGTILHHNPKEIYMQHNPETLNEQTANNKTHQPWYRSQGCLFALLTVSTFHFAIVGTNFSNQFSIKPSVLVLKQESCDLVKECGGVTQPHGANECRVTAPFEKNMFGTSGIIHLEKLKIRLSEGQITLVGVLDEHIWSIPLILLTAWYGLSILVLVVLLILVLRSLLPD